jgi:tRNA U34 2-thiouridine synthase MnmA/TrmU
MNTGPAARQTRDVQSNLKFGRLIDRDQLGAQFIATGHFARSNGITPGAAQTDAIRAKTELFLSLRQDQLARVVSAWRPDQERHARWFCSQLKTADKEESMEICFSRITLRRFRAGKLPKNIGRN